MRGHRSDPNHHARPWTGEGGREPPLTAAGSVQPLTRPLPVVPLHSRNATSYGVPVRWRALRGPADTTTAFTTMTTTCALVWAAALLLLPVLFIAWLLESRNDRARRWRRQGMTQQAIATRLGCSRTTVRRMLA